MLIIGIGGGTGSGKTTVVNQILSEFPAGEVQVISQDSYYKETSHLSFEERCKINFDHPKSIDFELLESHLKTLKKEKTSTNLYIPLKLITVLVKPQLPNLKK